MNNILSVHSISAGYGKKQILENISFELEPHTLTCLIGKNGCGKTTLLKCIINQLSHEGECILEGVKLEEQTIRSLARMVSYIPQKNGIAISLPVLDVVLMGFNPVLKLLETPSKKQREQAKEALTAVGMGAALQEDYQTLSEGQKQLVLLARTLIENTKLLLLDEPDSALDFQNRHLILRKLQEIVQIEEKAGLLCLHDPILAMETCDQLILMKDGRVESILHPQKDGLETMETSLRRIYGNVSLGECVDKRGKRHFTLLWEETECEL